MDEALTWVLGILSAIWGTMLLKYWLDRLKAKRVMVEHALYLLGKLEGFPLSKDGKLTEKLRDFSDEFGKAKVDSAFVIGMIGYLEQSVQEAAELNEQYKIVKKSIGEWRNYSLALRQQITDAGVTPPELPEHLRKDVEAYEAILNRGKA